MNQYASNRQNLLDKIKQSLSTDERFVAAWLTGSFGRNEIDDMSDLDLTLVVADAFCEKLCARLQQTSDQTSPERLELFRQFGQPAILHENNNNAPDGGTFTFVLYAQTALMVDWVLQPQASAQRPAQSHLLFDKIGIPIRPQAAPENLEQRLETLSEGIAFFWMMIAVTTKYAIRHDAVFVQNWLEILTGIVHETERLIAGQAFEYHRGSLSHFETTQQDQVKAIRQLCDQMLNLMPQIAQLGGRIPASPMPAIEILLELAAHTPD